MRVLLTGGAGFIGSHIADKLLEKNHEVIIIDNLSSGSQNNLKKSDKLKLYKLDIIYDDLDFVFKNEKPDCCIHLAAQTSVVKSIENPVYDCKCNILASIKLLELCNKYNIRKFIASSSAAVYGMPINIPIDENHPTVAISYYGLSKLTMEKYIQLSKIPYIIFRFANVYGPRQASSKESGVVAIFNNAMLNDEPVNIYGDGEQIRDFVYVEDIAQACVIALESDIRNQIINYSTNKGITVNKLFTIMKELYNYPYEPNYLPERDGEIRDSILSNLKALSLLEGCHNTDINQGLKKLYEYSKVEVKL